MRRYLPYFLFAIIALTFLPWLGETLFNTKGEPREAIVAVSMLQSGNYILPESCGGDIPYKPPFLAWLIAACSFLTGGVNEFSSRLPSAIATIAMAAGIYLFVKRRSTVDKWPDLTAALTAAITVTAFEVFRAASACRVDMVLTACIVGAILLLNRRRDIDGRPRTSGWAIVLMSFAVLTKGPVGMILPCLIVGIYYLLRGDKFWLSFGVLFFSGLISMIGYIMWFVIALHIGGQEFFDLMWEENIGRMTGSMSYESHVNPFYYNFITIIAGMVPYTLLALMALFAVNYTKPKLDDVKARLKALTPVELLSIIAIVVTLVFYSIPASKRSVYLLPLYPFLSYWVARMAIWLIHRRSRVISIYAGLFGVLAIVVPIAVVVFNTVDFSGYFSGAKAETEAFVRGLHDHSISFAGWLCLVASVLAGVTTFAAIRGMGKAYELIWGIMSTFGIYWVLSSTAMPAVLNTKSDIRLARVVERFVGPGEKVYTFVDTPMLRYYTAGFYLDDRVVPIQGRNPREGYLFVGENDYGKFVADYADQYDLHPIYRSSLKSCDTRQRTLIVRFESRK